MPIALLLRPEKGSSTNYSGGVQVMGSLRVVTVVIGFASFLFGCFLNFSPNLGERSTGQTFAIAGAILIAGAVIGMAIVEKGRDPK